ncbi:MAG: CRISPR-associated protein Cas4 [bacterium]|nr:CRISPR-associated protein Cas4 [bacterium]
MEEIRVYGTLIWYYHICQREVWLIAHQLEPDREDTNVSIGRYLQEQSFNREKKELSFEHNRMDIYRIKDGKLVIGEVKKSSKFEKSARMQLLFYLYELKMHGVDAVGELLFPQEKGREEITLDEDGTAEIERVTEDIKRILQMEKPPVPARINYCRSCAYAEFCWS